MENSLNGLVASEQVPNGSNSSEESPFTQTSVPLSPRISITIAEDGMSKDDLRWNGPGHNYQ
jgi:hypothetical protein